MTHRQLNRSNMTSSTDPDFPTEKSVRLPVRQSLQLCTGTMPSRIQSLKFVTMSNPKEAKDSTNRFLVRSRVLKNYKAKKRQQRSATEIARSAKRLEPLSDILQHVLLPNPKTILSAGRVDPFSAYPRPLNSHEHQPLEYFITEFCPKHDPLYSREFPNALSSIWLPEAVKQQGLLNGILLVSGRDLMQVAPNKELGSLILQLRRRLILDVNEANSDKQQAIRDESIGTLLELAFDELATGNWADLATHLKGLKFIIQLRSNLSTTGFQGFLSYLMARVNLVCALHKPLTSPHSPNIKPENVPSVENLNSGFLAIAILRNLSAEMITILNFFTALTTFLEQVPLAAPPPVGSYSIEESFSAYETEWKSLSLGKKRAWSIFEEPDIERCMVFAAGVYRSRVLYEDHHYPLPSSFSLPRIERYKAGILRLMESPRRTHYLPLILWMAFIGSLAIHQTPIGSYWPHLIHGVAKELRIKTWDEARLLLRRFLWLDRRCEGFACDLWENVEHKATHV